MITSAGHATAEGPESSENNLKQSERERGEGGGERGEIDKKKDGEREGKKGGERGRERERDRREGLGGIDK